jgi:hypothetical protein
MIELPRACFIADRIAQVADFFSFGTNDLTQTALGLSRDDVEAGFLSHYLEARILDRSPFETIDRPGVGWLVRLAAWVGREAGPTSSSAYAENTAATPTRSRSSTWPGSTTSAAPLPRPDRAHRRRPSRAPAWPRELDAFAAEDTRKRSREVDRTGIAARPATEAARPPARSCSHKAPTTSYRRTPS